MTECSQSTELGSFKKAISHTKFISKERFLHCYHKNQLDWEVSRKPFRTRNLLVKNDFFIVITKINWIGKFQESHFAHEIY